MGTFTRTWLSTFVCTPTLAARRGRQLSSVDDLAAHQCELVTLRLAHLLEVETGFRGGDPLRPAPSEPRPGYDPAVTTVTQRRRVTVAEFAALVRTRLGYLRWIRSATAL